MDAQRWPIGWSEVVDVGERMRVETEMTREMPKGHQLFQQGLRLLGRSHEEDVFLFELGEGRVARVHLTWKQEVDPAWPLTRIYSTFNDWTYAEGRDVAAQPATNDRSETPSAKVIFGASAVLMKPQNQKTRARSVASAVIGWCGATLITSGLVIEFMGSRMGAKLMAIGWALVGVAQATAPRSEERPWWFGAIAGLASAFCAIWL